MFWPSLVCPWQKHPRWWTLPQGRGHLCPPVNLLAGQLPQQWPRREAQSWKVPRQETSRGSSAGDEGSWLSRHKGPPETRGSHHSTHYPQIQGFYPFNLPFTKIKMDGLLDKGWCWFSLILVGTCVCDFLTTNINIHVIRTMITWI